ncbi:thrombospondin type-1 domain-containing protein 7A isoform X2 [Petromyzon marinus]|uniref:thrombospondin type-1 domain-containing protein 7A isoform X2 n=1 Tax=Petromyzon marinus TaxID=7757 RepID=UPI003F7075C0
MGFSLCVKSGEHSLLSMDSEKGNSAMKLFVHQLSLTGEETFKVKSWAGLFSIMPQKSRWRLLLPLLLMMTSLASLALCDSADAEDNVYVWRAGPWGECVGEECGPVGVQSRAVWCAHAENWTTLLGNCRVEERPPNQRNCFRVCEWHRDLFEWDTGEWGSCRPLLGRGPSPPSRRCEHSEGQRGVRTRTFGCVQKTNRSAAVGDEVCAYFAERPSAEQGCVLPCPRDCVASEWAPWSWCQRVGMGTCGEGSRHRVRSVLVPPSYGGTKCPELSQAEPCLVEEVCPTADVEDANTKSQYRLKVGAWSACRPMPQPRTARHTDRRVPSSLSPAAAAAPSAAPLHARGAREAAQQEQASPPRLRELLKLRRSRNRERKQDVRLWDVQLGSHRRSVLCLGRDGKRVDPQFCGDPGGQPESLEPCVLSRACEVGEWSAWGPCSRSCRSEEPGAVGGAGFRSRSRPMVQVALGGGRDCPPLEEDAPCSASDRELPPCPRYRWRGAEWAECRVDALLSQQDRRRGNQTAWCGGGIQTRDLYCILDDENIFSYLKSLRERGELPGNEKWRPTIVPLLSVPLEISAPKPVDGSVCPAQRSLDVGRLCDLPCPAECPVSAWTAWGPCVPESCEEPQSKKGFMLRERKVLLPPFTSASSPYSVSSLSARESGLGGCPHLVEAIPCEDARCHRWHVAEVSICIPGNTKCGTGTQFQRVVCYDRHGAEAGPELCGDPGFPTQLSCLVPCPSDCVLSEWTTWSPCSHTCSSKNAEGKQSRTRSILAFSGDGGQDCPGEPGLQEWRPCNEYACTVYHWQAGPWGPCAEEPSLGVQQNATEGAAASTGETACAPGVQTRKVICVRVNVGQVSAKKCPENLRPDPVRRCLVLCRKDCVVTPYSDWTPCSLTCLHEGMLPARQSRYRMVVQRAANGGRECPDALYEERPCDVPPCPKYRWKTHKWRRCQLVPDSLRHSGDGAGGTHVGTPERCGPGLQIRALTCRREDGGQADPQECFRWASPAPGLTQPCRVACQDDCVFTSWSRWSPCTAPSCGLNRSRRRAPTGKSKKKPRCRDLQLYPLLESQPCPCVHYSPQPMGGWSDCVLPEGKAEAQLGMRVTGDLRECGQGTAYRALACFDQEGRLADLALCSTADYQEESCVVPCPSDCKLSEWSSWSRCTKSCGSGMKVRSKWLREKPYNRGRPCPKLDHVNQVYEAVPCHSECGQHVWISEPWTVCHVTRIGATDSCGEGSQTRTVRCVVNTVEGPGDTVDDPLCDSDVRLDGVRQCRLPCPNECVMSEWGPWTKCPQPCDVETVRIRSRFIQRMPADGETCPEDTESEHCVLNQNCFHYRYNLTEWSTCQLSERAVCGQGSRTRMLDCVRSDSKSVDLKYCEALGLERPRGMGEPCSVECSLNCQLSEWSAWTSCSHTCGLNGWTHRSRRVLQEPRGEGRSCPLQMEQNKPCAVTPCYRWQLGEWSECKVEGGDCGEGTRERNLTCLVHNGTEQHAGVGNAVEEELCAEAEPVLGTDEQPGLRVPCSVPCPGDCRLSDWSEWGPCQLTCEGSVSLGGVGVQARSRAVIALDGGDQDSCPDQPWEARDCDEGSCYTYEWKTSPWKGAQRLVWCERSDGIHVTGGCSPMTQPQSVRVCEPPCLLPNSYCAQGGVCRCEEGYQEVMTPRGLLEHCSKLQPGRDGEPPNEGQPATPDHGPGWENTDDPGPSEVLRTWTLQPYGPDGRLRTWVYGVSAAALVLLVFIISMTYLACKRPKRQMRRVPKRKPLPLAYDGDADL